MRFSELFNDDRSVNWKKVLSIKEFSNMKNVGEDGSFDFSVFDHTQKVVHEVERLLSALCVDKNSDYYLMSISAALCHDIGKNGKVTDGGSGENGSNICRKLFYDEDALLREKVCYMVRNHPYFQQMFYNDKLVRTIIRISYGLVTVRDMQVLYYADQKGCQGECDTAGLSDRVDRLIKMATDIKCYSKPYSFDHTSQKNEFFYQIPDKTYKKGKRFTVYFMVGLPGAGKDTYISKKFHGIPTVCRDDIRTEIGIKGAKPQGNKKEEDMVTKIVNERIIDFCEKRTTFVINNTNLKREYRDTFEKMVLPYKPRIVFVYVEAPSVADNKNRRSGQIQPSVIDRMARNFDFPEPYEYDEIRYDLQEAE